MIPRTMFTTPTGRSMTSNNRVADSGAFSAGFTTTVLPEASSGPRALRIDTTMKFHGTITAATPRGCRTTTVCSSPTSRTNG